MDRVPSRVGILDRGAHRIRSVRYVQGVSSLEEMGSNREGIRLWIRNQEGVDEDDSYLAFFYRCLNEGSEFYYVYDLSEPQEDVGWRCGGTTWNTPILGRLVPYEEARSAIEDWYADLKWMVAEGDSRGGNV